MSYVDEMQPWFLAKDPSKREQLHEVCTVRCSLFKTPHDPVELRFSPHTSGRWWPMELFGMNREFVWSRSLGYSGKHSFRISTS